MLSHLQIRDFAIVDYLELELSPGMTAMTGETGAGKSIMIDALGLLLGERADSTSVRAGATRAEISAIFDLGKLPSARAWLARRELDAGRDCQLRRVINPDGRSRAYINNTPQPLQALRELGDLFVDIHGQHAHQSLLRRDSQRELLDDYGGNQALLAQLGKHYQAASKLQRRLRELRQVDAERDSRLAFLRYQIEELRALNLQPSEIQDLEEEHLRLANAGRLLDTSQQALSLLYESDGASAHGLLSQSQRDLQALEDVEPRLVSIGELLAGALIQVQEASTELRRYLQHLELDPSRLEAVEQRLADIHALARKHRCPAAELLSLMEQWRAELAELDNSSQRQGQWEKDLQQALSAYARCADELSQRRRAIALEFGDKVTAGMRKLGMPGGTFEIALTRHDKLSPQGHEAVEFMVSANPGQPRRALNKVASGGELSRISLAIQVIAAHSAHIATLVFDEVDTGIGGGIAEVVGRQLRRLGKTHQVLCVTHLPQVAAQANRHLRIRKQTDNQSTRTTVIALGREDRVREIARMLGGLKLTESTLAHAREMVDHGDPS